MTATTFSVPTRAEVSPANQAIFDNLQKGVGMVPNLFAIMAHSDTALGNYLTFQNSKTSLSKKEREVINLIVSEVNDCNYCKAAHTAIGKMNGFDDGQILEIRRGNISFDPKLDALVKLAKSITEKRGKADTETVGNFLKAGYAQAQVIDVILQVGEKSITNYVIGVTDAPIDFPEVGAV